MASIEALKNLYFTLDQNFNDLFTACDTQAQKDQLRKDYVNARDNFWAAQNRVFHDDDPLVQQVDSGLEAAEQELQRSLAELTSIAAVLQVIDSAVSLGSRLITLGSFAG